MMPSVLLMNEEHRYIKRMLGVMRGYCQKVLRGEEVALADFHSMIDFVRNYADKHHHGKEEDIFFVYMMDELGQLAEKLVKMGMLVEHDLGRLLLADMETALKKAEAGDEDAKLDLISNAMGDRRGGKVYVSVRSVPANRHIDRRGWRRVVFTRNLPTASCLLKRKKLLRRGITPLKRQKRRQSHAKNMCCFWKLWKQNCKKCTAQCKFIKSLFSFLSFLEGRNRLFEFWRR
jgi:hypothetical protein